MLCSNIKLKNQLGCLEYYQNAEKAPIKSKNFIQLLQFFEISCPIHIIFVLLSFNMLWYDATLANSNKNDWTMMNFTYSDWFSSI